MKAQLKRARQLMQSCPATGFDCKVITKKSFRNGCLTVNRALSYFDCA